MTNADAISFPVIGVSSPRKGGRHAFVAENPAELHECLLHDYLAGLFDAQWFAGSDGRVFNAERMRVAGIAWRRAREVGLVMSVITSVFSGFNVPVRIDFDVRENGAIDVGALRGVLRECVECNPRLYTHRVGIQAVRAKLARARSFADLARAISN